MGLYQTANVQELLNAGVYAPLAGVATPMTEAVVDLATPLIVGQGVNVNASGVATLATDNATHVVAGSHLGLTDGTYQVDGSPKAIPMVGLGLALVDCVMATGETIVAGDEVAFSAGELVLATTETQKFVAKVVEGEVVRIAFK